MLIGNIAKFSDQVKNSSFKGSVTNKSRLLTPIYLACFGRVCVLESTKFKIYAQYHFKLAFLLIPLFPIRL